jgi:uncharacterized protein (UPF0332 family)
MPRFAEDKILIRVSKAKTNHIANWKYGIYLQDETGKSLDEIIKRAAVDRFRFAKTFLRDAQILKNQTSPLYRSAISRYYYSMYHALRSVAYIYYCGDDHEEHKILPGKIPDDFPDFQNWANELKNARERRNDADYEPYPKTNRDWEIIISELESQCLLLNIEVKKYLITKGCNIR